jgi:hypothetical protein
MERLSDGAVPYFSNSSENPRDLAPVSELTHGEAHG